MKHLVAMPAWVPLYHDSVSLDLAFTSPLTAHAVLVRRLSDNANSVVARRLLDAKIEAVDNCIAIENVVDVDGCRWSTGATVGHNDMTHDRFRWGSILCKRPYWTM